MEAGVLCFIWHLVALGGTWYLALRQARPVSRRHRHPERRNPLSVADGSFGGAASILASLDPRVKKVIANCPVVDWSVLAHSEKAETSNPSYAAYIRQAFGLAYRLSDRNWSKMRTGNFYIPAHHIKQIDPSKAMMFHAQDDPYVPYKSVARFADRTGIKLKSFKRGGHLSTDQTVRRYWKEIRRFFEEES